MRLSRMNSERGSIATFFLIAMPLMVAMLAVVVECGRIAVARTRVQAAADRAAFAGAAVVANGLNRIAAANWRIHKAWRDLDRDFRSDTQQDAEAAGQRFARYEAERDAAFEEIEATRDAMVPRARAISLATLAANAPRSEGAAVPRVDVALDDDADPDAQWGRVDYGRPSGGPIFTDPENVESGGFDALKFLIKRPASDAVLGVFAAQRVRPMLLGRMLGAGVEVRGAAAAQAFGGSIEGFARKEMGAIDEAEEAIDDGGNDALYRAALVPMWTLGEAGKGMRQ